MTSSGNENAHFIVDAARPVASLPRPGGNITGLSGQAPDTTGKRIELLREIVPGLRRLAMLADVGNPFTAREIDEVHGAAQTLALEADVFEIRRAEDIGPAFKALQGRAQALYVPSVPLFFVNRVRVNTFALVARLPTMYLIREPVEVGGLMSYGPNWRDMWRRAANLVDKILRGATKRTNRNVCRLSAFGAKRTCRERRVASTGA